MFENLDAQIARIEIEVNRDTASDLLEHETPGYTILANSADSLDRVVDEVDDGSLRHQGVPSSCRPDCSSEASMSRAIT